MNKQCKKILSLLMAVTLVFGLLPMGSAVVNAATPSITEADIDVAYPAEVALDLTGSTLTNLYHPTTYKDSSNTAQTYEGAITTSYEDGTFTVKWPGTAGQNYNGLVHLLDISVGNNLSGYSFDAACSSSCIIPLFVYENGSKVFGLIGNGPYIQYNYFNATGSGLVDDGKGTNGVTFPSSGKATYHVEFDDKDNPTKAKITAVSGDTQVFQITVTKTGILTNRIPVRVSNSTFSGYTQVNSLSNTRKTVQETKTPIVNFINNNPVLIDIVNGNITTAEQYLANKENAQNAMAAFAQLDTGLQDVIKQTSYYSNAVILTLNEIASFQEGYITEADVTTDYLVSQKLEITETMTAKVLTNTVTGVTHSYENGVLTVDIDNQPEHNKFQHIVAMDTNSTRKSYSFTGKFNDNVSVPLFVLTDGTVCGIRSESKITYFGTFTGSTFNKQSQSDWNHFYQAGSEKYTSDDVTFTVYFDHTDTTSIQYIVTKADGTVVTSQTRKVTSYCMGTTETVDLGYVTQSFTSSTAGSATKYYATVEHPIDLQEQAVSNHSIVSFVNANIILNTMKKDTAFSAANYIADDVYAKVTAAKTAYEALENAELKQAIVDNGFYNEANISAIIAEKAAVGLRAAFAGISPYLESGFAVDGINATSVKSNIMAAKTTFAALSEEDQATAAEAGIYNAQTLNKLYYTALAYTDGSISITDFAAEDVQALVNADQYQIPMNKETGLSKVTAQVSFAGTKTDTFAIDVYAFRTHELTFSNIRMDGNAVVADVKMVTGDNSTADVGTITIATTEDGILPEKVQTDVLTVTFAYVKNWMGNVVPKYTVVNGESSISYQDNGVTGRDVTRPAYVETAQTGDAAIALSSMEFMYYDTAKLAVPTMGGASIKTVSNIADQGLRIQNFLTGNLDTGAYELVEFGAVYITTHSMNTGDDLHTGYVGKDGVAAKTVKVEGGTAVPAEFFVHINGAASGNFAFTNFTVRNYVTYKAVATGKIFTIYSGNTDNLAENGQLTRRVTDTAVKMYEALLQNYDGALAAEGFLSERTALETVLADKTGGLTGATNRITELLKFECKYIDIIKAQ